MTYIHSHEAPRTWGDRLALAIATLTDWAADRVFGDRYAHRALVLETIAAVPGMIGALVIQLRAVRRLADDGGVVRVLVDEAENERRHLEFFTVIVRPLWWEWALIKVAQAVFVVGYFGLYVVATGVAHRLVAYLEEQAIATYTRYLELLRREPARNLPAPAMARDYWDLPPDATLHDVIFAIRDDEVGHRDDNHTLASRGWDGRRLAMAPWKRQDSTNR